MRDRLVPRTPTPAVSIVAASPAPAAALDPGGAVIAWNDAAALATGRSAEEMLGRATGPPSGAQLAAAGLGSRGHDAIADPVLGGGYVVELEPGGDRVVFLDCEGPGRGRSRAATAAETPTDLSGTGRDGLHEELARSVRGVAHDFNNLLTGIAGYADFILAVLEPHTAAHGDARRIGQMVERGQRLVARLRDLSRPEHAEPERVPRAKVAASRSADLASTRPRPGRGELVLVVDDEEVVRALAARALVRGGYEVVVASSADEAFQRVDELERSPDALVADVLIPGTDGYELARQMRERCPTTAILLVSGYVGENPSPPPLPGARTGFMAKPYSPTDLMYALRALIDT